MLILIEGQLSTDTQGEVSAKYCVQKVRDR